MGVSNVFVMLVIVIAALVLARVLDPIEIVHTQMGGFGVLVVTVMRFFSTSR